MNNSVKFSSMRRSNYRNGKAVRWHLSRTLAVAVVSAAWVTDSLSWAALPSGWGDVDIGSPASAGLASYTNGTWTITGGGADIWGAGDQFNFCSNSLAGDGMIIARVISQSGTDVWAQAGVMIRNDSTTGSPEAAALITPGNGVTFRYRLTAGGSTAQSFTTGTTTPVWVRLSRSTNTFTAAYSSDGINWTQLGSSQTIAMANTALAGLAVTAHNNALINTGQVANLLIVPGPQVGVPSNLINPYTGGLPFVGETTWPLPQINVASNALTPRMGWNSWFVVGDAIGPSESLIKSEAAALVTNGLAAAGYKYVVIDCTWIASGRGSRNANGNLIVDSSRWPDGMKAVADYVHSQGLFMGGYTDIGASGYGSPAQIGSFGYYQQDADQFANWGWDFIKIDDHGSGDFYAAAHAIASNDAGRPMAISFSTPQVDRLFFGPRLANSWRVANDITGLSGSVAWSSILSEFDTAQADWFAQAPGHCNDPDMLCVGMNGISALEGQTHFNLWCILGAPLMIGTDVTTAGGYLCPPLSAATLNTLTNSEVIAVDQDPLGAVGRPVGSSSAVYAKPLGSFTSGQYAVLLVNLAGISNSITVNWGDVGMPYGSAASVRDLWAHQNLGVFTNGYTSSSLPPHGSMMLLVTGNFDWNRPQTYEAESSYNSFSGTAYYVPENPNFSSGAYVTGVGFGATNAMQFNGVTAPSNGLYEVDIYYACALNRTVLASVNGGTATNFSFAATGSDTNDVRAMAVYLQLAAGENTLTFGNLTNLAPNLDKIVVSRGTPTGLQAVGGDSQVNLSWLSAANGVATFNVYRGTSSGGETLLASGLTTTNFSDTAVTNGVTYFYFITANNPMLGGESPPSAEASAEPRYATTSFAYSLAVLSNDPVAYWRFGETNGTTATDSVGGHNATYGSTVSLGVAGPRPADFLGFETTNTAAQFTNGVNNSWITIPALNLNTNAVTITAWIYPIGNQAAYTGLVFCRNGSTVSGMNLNNAGTDLGYTWNNNSGTWSWSSGVQPPANQWSFVALVVQPAGATVYLINTNGQQSATNSVANANQSFAGTGTIGTDTYSSTARAFNGIMDEVAVFNYALAPAQIQQLYASGHQLLQVQVGLQETGNNLNLTWPQGTLLQATSVTGPWLAVTNVVSPINVTPTNAAMFYRVLLH
jgi:hypothetical protein